ncbi:hypothetical protein An04g10370 [Aspergillus niger]|uniref:Uncharacterized protein n=2 Tax=Aspergillus niger TaxID=5061 RepID=A2QKE8_ASPNC|nr:hypothetical protein An04g10370 [Aspergillus niger]CAK44817.1 hypothetical protein An04g10370 [Aspergillus niger]
MESRNDDLSMGAVVHAVYQIDPERKRKMQFQTTVDPTHPSYWLCACIYAYGYRVRKTANERTADPDYEQGQNRANRQHRKKAEARLLVHANQQDTRWLDDPSNPSRQILTLARREEHMGPWGGPRREYRVQDLIAPKLFISTCLERSNFHVLFLIVYPIRLAADTAKVVNDRPKECQQSLISREECVPMYVIRRIRGEEWDWEDSIIGLATTTYRSSSNCMVEDFRAYMTLGKLAFFTSISPSALSPFTAPCCELTGQRAT